MGNAKDLLIRLLVDDDDLSKVDGAASKFGKLGDVTARGAAIGGGALVGLAGGAFAAANAAADAEQAQQQLQFALDKFPATADTNAEKLGLLNSEIAKRVAIGDDELASGQAILAQYGLTGKQIEELTPLLADYAVKTGQDGTAAAEALGKAMLGQGRALKAVGIDFTDTGTLGGNYQQVLEGLTTQVGGFGQAQADTAQGGAKILEDQTGELMEALGEGLLPALLDVTHGGIEFMGWMQENADLVKGLAIAVGVIAGALVLAHGAMTVFTAVQAAQTVAQWASNAAWLASPITWIILAIIVAVGLLILAGIWLVQNWDSVVKWLGEAWTNIAGAFELGAQQIGGFLGGMWAGIMDGATTAVNWIGDRVEGFIGFFTSIPQRIADSFQWLGDTIRNIAYTIASGIAWMWNNTVGAIAFTVPGWVPFIGGQRFDVPDIQIPALAAGGIATRATLALIGEAGPEAVVPLSQGAKYGLGGGGGGDVVVPVIIDGREMWRLVKRWDAREG